MRDVGLGKYDGLFQRTTLKAFDVYRAAQNPPPAPNVRLLNSSPVQPEVFVQPKYPPLARQAHIEGSVTFTVDIDPNGNSASFAVLSGPPMLRGAVEKAVSGWRFPKEAANQQVRATIDFEFDCPTQSP